MVSITFSHSENYLNNRSVHSDSASKLIWCSPGHLHHILGHRSRVGDIFACGAVSQLSRVAKVFKRAN